MVNPKQDMVQVVFYRDNGKPLMSIFFTIEEIAEAANYPLPENYWEQQAFLNRLRQCVYGVRDKEWRENARKLLAIKIKGEAVKYGFSNKENYLENDFHREKSRLVNQAAKVRQTVQYLGNRLPEALGQLDLLLEMQPSQTN